MYKAPAPKQKRTKDHEKFIYEDGLFYLRTTANADKIYADTVTARKMRNLLALWVEVYLDGIESVDPDEFCKRRKISASNYRRLIALVKEHLGVGDYSGNSVENTPSNKRSLTILTLNEALQEYGVDMKKFLRGA